MPARLEARGYGKQWQDITTDYYEGFLPQMTDYHMHDYYEISLILSGKVKVLLSDSSENSTFSKLVLLRPRTPHFIICEPNMLYRRHNLLFAPDFLADYAHDLQKLLPMFGKHGAVIRIDEKKCNEFLSLFRQIEQEKSPFRQKLTLLYFLSLVADCAGEAGKPAALPSFVSGALDYIAEHFSERLVAEELAWKLGVGRTTLMVSFKKHTGFTLNEYLTRYRLKYAIEALREGKNEQEVARASGFGDAPNLIRCFKKQFGMPPRRYLSSEE